MSGPSIDHPAHRRLPVLATEVLLLAVAGCYAFLVWAFFANGLHHFSRADLYWQQTAGAGDFPFSGPDAPGDLGFRLRSAAKLATILGSLFLPLAGLWVAMRIRSRWPALTRQERGLGVVSTGAALAAAAVMWSPLGWSILLWVVD